MDEAADTLWAISQGFGPHTREQWLALTRPMLKTDGDGFVPHYDPNIAVPFRAITPEAAKAGEAVMWAMFDSLRCPTLLLRLIPTCSRCRLRRPCRRVGRRLN